MSALQLISSDTFNTWYTKINQGFDFMGDLSGLATTDKSSLVNAINEVFVGGSDPGIVSIGALTEVANQMLYTTGPETYALTTLTPFARTILDDADAATVRTTIGLVIGTDVQTQSADLDAIDGTGNGVLVKTGSGTASARTLTAGSSKINVSNGDGVSGNPTVDLTEGNVVHDNLSGSGTNTHTQIDTHIADSSIHVEETTLNAFSIAMAIALS